MSRRTRSHGPTLSLFPFLSILAGVIGTMALIISGMIVIGVRGNRIQQIIESPPVSATRKSPLYVECHSRGLIVHPEGTNVSLADLDRDRLEINRLGTAARDNLQRLRQAGSAYLARIGKIKQYEADHYLLLLVRSDGFETFELAMDIARQVEVGIGYEPVFSTGPIKVRASAATGAP